ncbi:MAG: hypothetical protein O7G87_02935 [bacterium]|nr:hypothetical protein [bacterium]
MNPNDPRYNPYHDPDKRPSSLLLLLIALGVAIAVTLFGGLIFYLRDVFTARPLG